MKKLLSALCAAGLFFWLVAFSQAENHAQLGLREIFPGECYLDGRISPPKKSIDDMAGFEVPLVVMWIPVELNDGGQYRGEAKFGVYNFKIGKGELIDAYIVDVDLKRDDPGLSEKERHNQFIYRCKDGSGSCTATLATVKAAITEQIARDYGTAVEDVIYENDASVNFLGVFVRELNPLGLRAGGKSGQIFLHTEICGTYEYEITMAEASTYIK